MKRVVQRSKCLTSNFKNIWFLVPISWGSSGRVVPPCERQWSQPLTHISFVWTYRTMPDLHFGHSFDPSKNFTSCYLQTGFMTISARINKNFGLETWIWRHIVMSQTEHSKYKRPPYASEWKPPMNIFCVRHWFHLTFPVAQLLNKCICEVHKLNDIFSFPLNL